MNRVINCEGKIETRTGKRKPKIFIDEIINKRKVVSCRDVKSMVGNREEWKIVRREEPRS